MEGTTQSERNWAAICHLAAFAGLLIPLGNILGPLIVWLLRREESEFANDQGKESLNFQISISIYLLGIVTFVIVLGLVSLLAVAGGAPEVGLSIPFALLLLVVFVTVIIAVFSVIAVIIGAVRAGEGQYYRYPLNIRFIR